MGKRRLVFCYLGSSAELPATNCDVQCRLSVFSLAILPWHIATNYGIGDIPYTSYLKKHLRLHAVSALMTQRKPRTRQNEAAKNTICTSCVPAANELRPCGLPWTRQREPLPCLKSGNLTLPLATSSSTLIGLLRSFSALQGDETPCPERRQPPSHAGDSIA